MSKLPLSVFIIAKDEEDRIGYSITSLVDWVEEVIVIDSGSHDNTVALSENLGAKVYYHEWKGYGPQKVYGESLCSQEWILNIDADEEVSQALKAEILALFKQGPKAIAYHIPIRLQGRFADKPSFLAPSNDPVRLYKRSEAGFKESTVHDSVIVKGAGRTAKLKAAMHHRSFRGYAHAVEKINSYSSMQAEDMVARGRIPSGLRIVIEPFFAFLKAYFLRRYCFMGVEGVVESVIYCFSRTIRLAKARELQKVKKGN